MAEREKSQNEVLRLMMMKRIYFIPVFLFAFLLTLYSFPLQKSYMENKKIFHPSTLSPQQPNLNGCARVIPCQDRIKLRGLSKRLRYRCARASRFRTAFHLNGNVCGCGCRRRDLLGIADAAKHQRCRWRVAVLREATGVTLVKPFASRRSSTFPSSPFPHLLFLLIFVAKQ